MEIFPPSEAILQPMKHKQKTLFGPGPSNCYPRVLEAVSQQTYGIMIPDMKRVLADIQEGLRYVFQTKNVLTYAVGGSGMSGMEAAFVNMVEPGDKVLILANGQWGQRAEDVTERCRGVAVTLKHEPGVPFTFDEIEKGLKEHRPHLLFVAQGESSTGVAQPVENIGQLCHKYDCLAIVDTVASLGGIPFFMDKWEVDIVYSATQKVLSCPAGVAPISFSERARTKIANRKTKIQSFYFDVNLSAKHWGLNGPHIYHHTPAINTLFGLRETLTIIAQEGLQASWKKHRENAQLLWKGLEDMGLEVFIKDPDYRLPTITPIKVPEDLSDPYRVNAFVDTNLDIEIAGGLPPLVGKVWRIGLMGYNSTPVNVEKALNAMKMGLQHIGYTPKIKAEL